MTQAATDSIFTSLGSWLQGPLKHLITEYSPAFLFNSADDNDCIPSVDVVSVGVITVGRGVAGDWANTQTRRLARRKIKPRIIKPIGIMDKLDLQ